MKELDSIYFAARELSPGDRPAYLTRVCEGDPALRARVEQMLAVSAEAEAFLTDLPDDQPEGRKFGRETVKDLKGGIADDEVIGQKIGRYKILERVGEGGCGVVYVAEQTEPMRRRVALKVIKLGMDTKQVVARFEAERQALAMMDHPNIAKVLDGGATDNGRPYFIMELVRGIKITDYCDQASLPTKDRLDLFIQVCHAIQHAHQKGIIHRDIKPSNILVTLNDGLPVPKVIDFGIAKATEGRLTEATVYTQLHQFIGTPAYMSPEQAEMSSLDIDTRSDIYSLGVLLYELLAGVTPFDGQELLSLGIDAMRKTIREKQPVRPSTRLATLQGDELTTAAKRRAVEAPKLIHLLKGDLDWIVMKSLEKDRTRRYGTANGLAADIKRHLDNEPVLARPPSRLYEFQKTFRRHRVGFAATAAIILALSAGVVMSAWQAVRAGNAEREQRILHAAAETSRAGEAAQRKAAQNAEAEQARQKIAALEGLYTSLLGEARATRLARRVGYRQEVFKLLQQARALEVPQKNLADLRQQAVACLGDFIGLAPTIFSNSPGIAPWTAALDPLEKQVVFALEKGGAQLCDRSPGSEIAHLGGTNAGFDRFSFNATGDQLWGMRGSMENDGLCRRTYSWKVDVEVEPVQTFAPASGGRRIYSWKRDVDGRWQDAGDFALPGAVDFVRTGMEVSVVVAEIGSNKSSGAESWLAKFKLFNVSTRAFISGREVTKALPARCEFRVATTPNGELLAVHSTDAQNPTKSAQVNVYRMQTGQRIAHQDLDQYGDIKMSPDGKYLAWGSSPGSVIWTLPDLKRIGEFTGYFEDAPSVGRHMVELRIAQQPLRLRLWNPIRREDITLIDETRSRGGWTFGSDDRFLLSYPDPVVYPLVTPEKPILPPHADAVTEAEFSPDGLYLASVGKERVVRVCDSATGHIQWETNDLPGPGQCVGYSPDGQWLAVGTEGSGAPCIRDARTGKRLLDLRTNGTGKTWSVQFSKDGHYLAATGEDGTQIWTIERDTNGEAAGGLKVKLVKSRPRAGQSLLFAPDSRYLALADTWQGPIGFSLYLWDLDMPEAELVASDNSWGAQCESFTPDSRSLLMMGPNREIVTVDLASRKRTESIPTRDFKGVRGSVNNFSLSPDGSKLAFATSSMRGVDIWDPKRGTLLYSLPEEDGTVYWLAWSPDSRRLAVTRDDGKIGIWNLDTVGQILTELGLNP